MGQGGKIGMCQIHLKKGFVLLAEKRKGFSTLSKLSFLS